MSVFPRQLGPGQIVTIHARLSIAVLRFPRLVVQIHDPLGAVVFSVHETLAQCVPCERPASDSGHAGVEEDSLEALVLERLSPGPGREALARTLAELRRGFHAYYHWTVPEAAVPGCYRVEIGIWIEGVCYGSRTADTDAFVVERRAP